MYVTQMLSPSRTSCLGFVCRAQVAVVVDTFAEFRLNDVQNLAEEGGG